MKLFIFGFLIAFQAQADFRELHNKNFDAIGTYCGLHFEVNGDVLYATNIVNEIYANGLDEPICGYQYQCSGQTHSYRCVANICSSDGSRGLEILSDGNIIKTKYETGELIKFVPAKEKYRFCP
jgi:hypothetical protein